MPAPDPKELDQANLMRGQFVSAWSWLEMRLRALELMHTGKHRFKPVDLGKSRLKSGKRFRERVQEVIPPGDMRAWLLQTQKIRNLVLHGVLIGLDGELALAHADMQATLEAGRERNEAKIPSYSSSLPPDQVVRVLNLKTSVERAHKVAGFLREAIDDAHRYGEVRLSSSPDGSSTVSQHRASSRSTSS